MKPATPRNGTQLKRRILDEHDDLEADRLALLDVACAALDQALAAEKIVKRQGLIVTGARGPKPHPAVQIATSARHRMIRALGALKLL
jgi:phage terminase small subunit